MDRYSSASMAFLLAVLAAPAYGAPTKINDFTSGDQSAPKLAVDARGDYVVVWVSPDQAAPGSGADIYARLYILGSGKAQPQGPGFLVNSFTTGDQEAPAVAMDAAGDFVVVWESQDQAGAGSGFDIYAQRYDKTGTALGTAVLVNTVTTDDQQTPAVATDADGDFTVAWASHDQVAPGSGFDVYARQYSAAGTPRQAQEFRVNTYTADGQYQPTVAMDAGGDAVIAWASRDQAKPASATDVYARRYGPSGVARESAEFLVNEDTDKQEDAPAAAMDAKGDFVVAWEAFEQRGRASGFDVFARSYDATGKALNDQIVVDGDYKGTEDLPAVAMDAMGDITVAWETRFTPTDPVFSESRRFDLDGTPASGPSDGAAAGSGTPVAVAMDAAGDQLFVTAAQLHDDTSVDVYMTQAGSTYPFVLTGSFDGPASLPSGDDATLILNLVNATPSPDTGVAAYDAVITTVQKLHVEISGPKGPPDAAILAAAGSDWDCTAPQLVHHKEGPSGSTPAYDQAEVSCDYSLALPVGASAAPLRITTATPACSGVMAWGAQPGSLRVSGSGSASNFEADVALHGGTQCAYASAAVADDGKKGAPGLMLLGLLAASVAMRRLLRR